jgi:hypothetical protein
MGHVYIRRGYGAHIENADYHVHHGNIDPIDPRRITLLYHGACVSRGYQYLYTKSCIYSAVGLCLGFGYYSFDDINKGAAKRKSQKEEKLKRRERAMKVIVCLEDNNGMTFNRRRLSFDAVVIQRILDVVSGEKLWMNEYSAELFSCSDISVSADFMERAEYGHYCFVENIDILPYADRIEKIIIFRWNRRYPSDLKFSFSLEGWNLVQREEFAGKSHPQITQEVYAR